MHGKGRYSWADGLVWEGEVSWGTLNGSGSYVWPDGSTYQGQVENGHCHGEGRLVITKRDAQGVPHPLTIYEGQWREGLRHGNGTLVSEASGSAVLGTQVPTNQVTGQSRYEGQWEHGRKHGYGTMSYGGTGNLYEGYWEHDLKHGEGVMYWVDKHEEYRGEWGKDLPHGLGQYFWWMTTPPSHMRPSRVHQCNHYVGSFHKGLRHGYGRFYYANGSYYEGLWEENRRHGRGVYVLEEGTVVVTTFDRDHPALPLSEMRPASPEPKIRINDLIYESFEDPHLTQRKVGATLLRFMSDLRILYDQFSTLPVTNSKEADEADEPPPATATPTPPRSGTTTPVKTKPVLPWAIEEEEEVDDHTIPRGEGVHPSGIERTLWYTMTLAQFWQFLQECRIPCAAVPLPVINAMVARSKRLPSEVAKLRDQLAREGHVIAEDVDSVAYRSIHDSTIRLSFLEFCETLVRIAHAKLGHLPSLERRVHTLLGQTVIPLAGAPLATAFRRNYEAPEVQDLIADLDEDLYTTYVSCTRTSAQVSGVPDHDSATDLSNFARAMGVAHGAVAAGDGIGGGGGGLHREPSEGVMSLGAGMAGAVHGDPDGLEAFPHEENSVTLSADLPQLRSIMAFLLKRGIVVANEEEAQPGEGEDDAAAAASSSPSKGGPGSGGKSPRSRSPEKTVRSLTFKRAGHLAVLSGGVGGGEGAEEEEEMDKDLAVVPITLSQAVACFRAVMHPGDFKLAKVQPKKEEGNGEGEEEVDDDEEEVEEETKPASGDAGEKACAEVLDMNVEYELDLTEEDVNERATMFALDLEVLYPEFIEGLAACADKAVVRIPQEKEEEEEVPEPPRSAKGGSKGGAKGSRPLTPEKKPVKEDIIIKEEEKEDEEPIPFARKVRAFFRYVR